MKKEYILFIYKQAHPDIPLRKISCFLVNVLRISKIFKEAYPDIPLRKVSYFLVNVQE